MKKTLWLFYFCCQDEEDKYPSHTPSEDIMLEIPLFANKWLMEFFFCEQMACQELLSL